MVYNHFQFLFDTAFQFSIRTFLAILKIDGKVATQDKMNCITKCSKAIFHMLKISNQGLRPISADDFFPTLVFVCIKANPPRIQSNLNFVRRFANENKLSMGEGGYLFVNIVRFKFLRYKLYIIHYSVIIGTRLSLQNTFIFSAVRFRSSMA